MSSTTNILTTILVANYICDCVSSKLEALFDNWIEARISSWRPRKIACVVESIGVLVADICVVAAKTVEDQFEVAKTSG